MIKYIYAYHRSSGFDLNFKLIGDDKNAVYTKLRQEYTSESQMQAGTAMRIDNWNHFNMTLIDAKYHHIDKIYIGYHYDKQHHIPEIYTDTMTISLNDTNKTLKSMIPSNQDHGIIECRPNDYHHIHTLKRRLTYVNGR